MTSVNRNLVSLGAEESLSVTVAVSLEIDENLYDGWHPVYEDIAVPFIEQHTLKSNGHAFGREPACGSFPGQPQINGYEGERLINTKRRNLGTFVGVLHSDPFPVQGPAIDFLIGGGAFGLPTSVNLLVEGASGEFERVRTTTGNQSYQLDRQKWDVSEFMGRTAVIEIVDYASVEPFGSPSWPEDEFGFILVDDIRQLDAHGRAIDAADDAARNFNFERVKAPEYCIELEPHSECQDIQVFHICRQSRHIGRLEHRQRRTVLDDDVVRVENDWSYRGETVPGVKLEFRLQFPLSTEGCEYYVIPGLLYNGNDIGDTSHYLGEDVPEDAASLPAGFSVEDGTRVFGAWVEPQAGPDDPMVSVRLQQNLTTDTWEAVYLLPKSAQFGRKFHLDEDQRLTLTDGFRLSKTFYVYAATKRSIQWGSNQKVGFGQVVQAAWRRLYSSSPTNPPHSMSYDYRLKLIALLHPRALMQEVTTADRTYRIWFVGRWILGHDYEPDTELVPMAYFHRYTGFSWSGMIGLCSYNAFKEYLRSGDRLAFRVAEDTLDFFANYGVSPLGILFPAYYHDQSNGELGHFGSYAGIDEIDIGYLGEQLFWYIQCYQLLRNSKVIDKQHWMNVVSSSLDALMRLFPDGDIPGRINGSDASPASRAVHAMYWNDSPYTTAWSRGERVLYTKPSEGGPTGINLLAWAYAAYYEATGEDTYLRYAETLGDRIYDVLAQYGRWNGMEADYFNIDKRMGHAALAAFNRLYAITRSEKWKEAAIIAGEWFATWQYAFNVNFESTPELPLAVFDYRTVGGTTVDVKYSTNNTTFQQGATEFLKLWESTGDRNWFERARALLHQGTQNTLTEPKRQWLNQNFQGPLRDLDFDNAWFGTPSQSSRSVLPMPELNPNDTFDRFCVGAGTEDVLCAWPSKGYWTSKGSGILSAYMLAEGLDWDDIQAAYGGLTYSFKWKFAGALDTLDSVAVDRRDASCYLITARNMLDELTSYRLKLLDCPSHEILLDGVPLTRQDFEAGVNLPFAAHETRTIEVRIPEA